MPRFALKGALADVAQLEARAAALVAMGRPVVLELHTFGARDVDTAEGRAASRAAIARLRETAPDARLVLHVPVQQVPIVTEAFFDVGQCARSIALAGEIGAQALVIHRYGALVAGSRPPRIGSKAEAVARFEAIVRDLARSAPDLTLLVENVGHYALLPRDGTSFLAGPLDHFFPWEIAAFRAFLAREGIGNVAPFVDVAHATLSANLFNRKRVCPAACAGDPRCAWIDADDLDRAARLHPFDFVDPAMPWLHVSDAVLLGEAEIADPRLAEPRLVESIVSEGLEIGTGDLPFAALAPRLGPATTLVLEVEPGPGESHVANGAQVRSLARLAALLGEA
ncbi:hypothetical protein [Salinarimonas rosea]|uniref:hypothetical protein n=1 Tax=Salinarimonas rosea TaxID=552063 RepID=UPI000400FACE|nr:hypothetical protein [Salinarimonas rosea]